VFAAIARDHGVPKVSTTPASSSRLSGRARVLTTSPSKVKVEVLNGSGAADVASEAAAGLTSRGFVVTGTGDAPNFAYTESVIEYTSAADLAAVHTLEKELTHVTSLQVASLTPGTVDLILGSDFNGLAPKTPRASATPTATATNPTATATGPSTRASASAGASPSASSSGIAGLAQSTGGITAATACNSDSSAFSG